jgi:hypothetical protein
MRHERVVGSGNKPSVSQMGEQVGTKKGEAVDFDGAIKHAPATAGDAGGKGANLGDQSGKSSLVGSELGDGGL